MVGGARLWYRTSPKGREFEAKLRNPMTGKLYVNTAVNGYLFDLAKDKAAKGEGWAPSVITCAQDTVGLTPPAPMAIRLWEPFTFLMT